MNENRVRIIGGKWRGRKIQFPTVDGLRPTPDRVRETLFNWLMRVIDGAECLDLFAGTGANSFEALSRGGASATLVELSRDAFQLLTENKKLLDADNAILIHQDALEFLDQNEKLFDVIFLDPPFQSNLMIECFERFQKKLPLKENGYLYIEYPSKKELPKPPDSLHCLKSKTAGELQYSLWQYQEKI